MSSFKKAKDISVGVIGYGGAFNMGRAHLQEMQAAGMTPVAVVEIDASRLESAQKDFPGIETYDSVATFLKRSKADLVTVITPHNTHAKLALQCLKAGKHVVVEKPFAITTAECDAVIDAAKQKQLLVSTYHNRHWDGWILRAVEEIRVKKSIGEVFRVDLHMGQRGNPGDWWRTSRSISGGILYDWGVHLLEYALQLIDSQGVEVSGYSHEGFWAPKTKWKNDANEDEAMAVIRFKNGAWINLCISQLEANPDPIMAEFHGTEGTYEFGWEHFFLHRMENGVQTTEKGRHFPSAGHKFYENIAAHLTRGQKLIITPEWSRRPIHFLELAGKSAKLGRSIPADDRWSPTSHTGSRRKKA